MKTKKDFYLMVKQMRFLQKTANGSVDCKILERDIDTEIELFFKKVVEESEIDTEKKKSEFEKRKDIFYKSLIPYTKMYEKDMIRKFYDYWTEPNKSHTKMRWELEKTWDVKRRLNTWASREPVKKETTPLKLVETESERLARVIKEEKERDKNLIPVPKGYNTFTWYKELERRALSGDEQAKKQLSRRIQI